MRTGLGRTLALLVGGALAMAGWGAVFPYLYADIDNARHLGAFVAAVTFTAFAIGSIAAAPLAGWLADRVDPVLTAVAARVGLATFIVALALAHTASTIWLAAAGFGAALAIAQPAMQVILLNRTAPERRRDIFAWQFITQNLGLAAGASIGGAMVDLSTPHGTRPLYLLAAVAAIVSAVVVARAGRGTSAGPGVDRASAESVSYRELLQLRPIRWLLLVALLITLACYAQYDSGLPAYILAATSVGPAQLGTAVALNAVLVAVLTGPVVAFTRRYESTSLLAVCAGLWIACWLVFAMPLVMHGYDTVFVLLGFATMSVGETMMAPILSPLAANLAPAGGVGRTLASVTGATTVATAIGPVLAGALLGLHLAGGFIVLQVLCCLGAVLAARKLQTLIGTKPLPAGHLAADVASLTNLSS